MFFWRHRRVNRERDERIEERAKQIARMVILIVHGLKTKSYDDFVDSFSNPGGEPSSLERSQRLMHFQMQMSATCGYDAIVEYPADGTPLFSMDGYGDDSGVHIRGDAIEDHPIEVDYFVNSQRGCDARAVVHVLRRMPGWSRVLFTYPSE